MKTTLLRGIILMAAIFSLAACRTETTYYDESGYYYEEDSYDEYVVVETVFAPELEAFYLTDSYGSSSERAPVNSLILDPYIDNGWFDISWVVDSWDDYWVEFYISDNPDMDNASYIGSQLCGQGLECDEDGLQMCRYTPDYGISCDTGEEHVAYIDYLIYAVPQTLYFITQVCDVDFEHCEYQFEPVLMY